MKEVLILTNGTDSHLECQKNPVNKPDLKTKIFLFFLIILSVYAVAQIITIIVRIHEINTELAIKEEERAELKKFLEDRKFMKHIGFDRKRRSISRQKKYVVSRQTHFVNCNRFKPVQRGKYLVPPSLDALHTCYKHGVRLRELDQGILKNNDGELRYDLDNLYVQCEDVFNLSIDEMTNDLAEDYARCKWSGLLDESQQKIIEERFADILAAGDKPANIVDNPTTPKTPSTKVDIRGFVECSHVETELFEDYFEAPSVEALRRCQNFGVTLKEIEKGLISNPMPPVSDVGDLYISCMDVFDGHIDYMTSELKEDYRRCKSVGAINNKVQDDVEKRFYEVLSGVIGTTEKTPSTTITPKNEKTTTIAPTTTTTAATTTTTAATTTTTTSPTTTARNRYTFANCRPVENKPYLVCIKIIKVYGNSIFKPS